MIDCIIYIVFSLCFIYLLDGIVVEEDLMKRSFKKPFYVLQITKNSYLKSFDCVTLRLDVTDELEQASVFKDKVDATFVANDLKKLYNISGKVITIWL